MVTQPSLMQPSLPRGHAALHPTLQDNFGRVLSYLRVSVTDRCNFRCVYCMPEHGVELGPREDLLSFEEIARVCRVAAHLGLTKVRLTGGEPTVRRDLPALVAMLRAVPQLRELAMTTNASRLGELAAPLKQAGLDRLNISLDTLDVEKSKRIARRDIFSDVMRGLDAARIVGLPMKFNAVVMRGQNDDELADLARFAHECGGPMRFIEWMPMGGVVAQQQNAFVSTREMRAILDRDFDLVPDESCDPTDPARLWRDVKSGVRVGFISSVTDEFCATCNRMRLTSDGGLRPCLHQDAEVPLREMLRADAEDAEIASAFQRAAAMKWAGHQMNGFVPLYSLKNMVAIGG